MLAVTVLATRLAPRAASCGLCSTESEEAEDGEGLENQNWHRQRMGSEKRQQHGESLTFLGWEKTMEDVVCNSLVCHTEFKHLEWSRCVLSSREGQSQKFPEQ